MNSSIGDKIKRLRIEKKLSQEALARALYFSNRTISNWENNLREVSMYNLQKLANYFQVPIAYFTEEKMTTLPSNGSYQQVKVKKIALSDRFYYFLFVLIMMNATLLWIPFDNRISLAALLLVFWVGMLIVTIGRYTAIDRQRTKAYFVSLDSRIKYVTNFVYHERRRFKIAVILHYALIALVTLFFYLGIYTMINIVAADQVLNVWMISFITFITLTQLFIIFKEIFSGVKQAELPYAIEHYDFGMTIHRSVVTLHYAMVIFILVYLNAYGAFPFRFELLLFALINGLALIVLLRMNLLMHTRYFDSYRLVIEDFKQ